MSEEALAVGLFFIFGTLWGSFANVVIARLPAGQSVVLPRSRCPKCQNSIAFYDNIPIVSWLILRGRCRQCRSPISVRYPIVELLMGLGFAAVFQRFGWSISTAEALLFIFGLLTSSFIDLDHMILPDQFTLSGIGLGLLGAWLNPDRLLLDAILGVLMGGGLLLSIAYFYLWVRKIEGMGGGDIKLLAWIGAVCGWQSILFVMVVSSLVGLVFGLFYMLRSQEGLKTGIPFGPYLAFAAFLYLIWGQEIWMAFLYPTSG